MVTAIFMGIAGVVAALLAGIMWRLGRCFRLFRVKKHYSAAISAPSVSVCIPARNETHAMTECLQRVLANNYAKMEVIVFDDSSSDDTSILIRSFAHAGVRFVPGPKLPAGWLGKNHALEVLAQEASGTFIIFIDVDTYIQPTTISQLVGYMLTEKTDMVSVVPRRDDAWRLSVLLGHLRYFWELVLSRTGRPATASALWMIRRRTLLDKFGGFGTLKASVAPESALARLLGTTAYHCLIASPELGVAYEKKWQSQLETSRRLLYPKAGGRWWYGIAALMGLLLLNLPFFAVLSVFFVGQWTPLHTVALLLLLAEIATYTAYTSKLWGKSWWLGGLLWPVVILQELLLFISSVWGYARRSITWKGRPVASTVQANHIER